MLADRVRMMFGSMKGMKTYDIELLTAGSGALQYIDLTQETGVIKTSLTTSPQLCKVSRYIIFTVTADPLSSSNIVINNTINVNTYTPINPGVFTHINGVLNDIAGVGFLSVFVIDLEKVAQYSGIAIENITRIKLPIMED